MDPDELVRLAHERPHPEYDRLAADEQQLTFSELAQEAEQKLRVSAMDKNVLRTLDLLLPNGQYTNAAALLADRNAFPGITLQRFGATVNDLYGAPLDLAGRSVLAQFRAAVDFFTEFYVPERIDGASRTRQELIPLDAFREGMANALVHRDWQASATGIMVHMHPEKVVITSPGGLPPDITTEEYLEGRLSSLRNPVLAYVFFRLGHIERLGTGILRIREAYAESASAPEFDVRGNSVSVTLPLLRPRGAARASLRDDERRVHEAILSGGAATRKDVESATGFGKDKVTRILRRLVDSGLVARVGAGRGVRYHAGGIGS